MPTLTPQQRSEAARRIDRARRYAAHASARSLLEYLRHVVVDCRPEPRPFRDVAQPWQWTLLGRLLPALENAAGVRPGYHGPLSFWLTLPRGHDKSSSIGRLLNWCIAFARKQLRCTTAAADREQASLILEFMQAEANLNPWLGKRLEFRNWRVDSPVTGSRLKVLSADDKSSFGLKEDVMVLDELTHWPKRGLWDTIVSGREKRPESVLVVITNAGELRTWQREVFEEAKSSPDWYVYESPPGVQLATWMDPERVGRTRRLLPPGLAKRVFDNVWVDPAEDAGFVTPAEALACVDPALDRRLSGARGTHYVASVDYGPKRDRTVCCVGHADGDGRVVCDRMDVYQGKDYAAGRVPVEVVERWVDDVAANFFRPTLVVDPYQMEGTCQKYEGALEVVRFEARGGKANYELAANLRNLIVNRRLAWYASCGDVVAAGKVHSLAQELSEVVLRSMTYGYRIDHEATGHDDRVIALGQLALQLVQSSGAITIPPSRFWF